MPGSKIYPKVIDSQDYGAIVNVTSGVPYITIAYSVYENFNPDSVDWDSKMTYAYWFALNSFSYTTVNNADNGEFISVSFSCNGVTLQFNLGDYVDPNGNVILITDFISPVQIALGV